MPTVIGFMTYFTWKKISQMAVIMRSRVKHYTKILSYSEILPKLSQANQLKLGFSDFFFKQKKIVF